MIRPSTWLAAALLGATGTAASVMAQPSPPARNIPQGETVYLKWCAACHNPGNHHPGTNALAAKYGKDKPAVLLRWTDLDPDYVKVVVRTGVSVMPHFRKTEISDPELDALARWLAVQGKK